MNLHTNREDSKVIAEIAKRASGLATRFSAEYDTLTAMMDVTAAHMNGCPIDLDALLMADDMNFTHDVFGIRRHINRTTGVLEDCFVPRFAQR